MITPRRIAILCLFAVLFWLLAACGQKPFAQIAATNQIYSSADIRYQIPGAICGDSSYAQVDSRSLPAFYDAFRQQIFDEGVVK